MDRTCFVFWMMQLLSGMAWLSCHAADSVEGRGGVKTEFCPNVTGFCPGVSGILSHSDRGLSASALPWGRVFRRGAQCSGEKQVKSEGSGGADVTVVLEMQCSEDAPRARARWESGYDLEGVDQGQSVQAVVEDFQWGRMLDGRWIFFYHEHHERHENYSGFPDLFRFHSGPIGMRFLIVRCQAGGHIGPHPAMRIGGLVLVWGCCAATSCCLRQSRIASGTTQGT